METQKDNLGITKLCGNCARHCKNPSNICDCFDEFRPSYMALKNKLKEYVEADTSIKTRHQYIKIKYTDLADAVSLNGKRCNTTDNVFPLSQVYDNEECAFEYIIDLDSGKVINWKQGDTAKIYSKPVDAGEYTLLDKDFKELETICDYVIEGLDIDDDGYGDYVIFSIQESGRVLNWNSNKILSNFKNNE